MVELLNLEIASVRQRAKRAEVSLKQAENLLNENHGIAISLALCSRIRAGQARAKAAKRRLAKIIATH